MAKIYIHGKVCNPHEALKCCDFDTIESYMDEDICEKIRDKIKGKGKDEAFIKEYLRESSTDLYI